MPESAREELTRRLAGYPKEALSFFDAGFIAASKLSEETRSQVLREVINDVRRGIRGIGRAELRVLTKLSEQDLEQLVSVYSVLIGLLSESSATPDDFVESARGILFLPEQENVARAIANSICVSRQEIRASVERAQLAVQALPSLESFDIALDIRVRIVDNEIRTTVPVALVHIDTDVNEEMYLQLTMGDIELVIRRLSKTLEEMKLAETLRLVKR